MMMIDNSSRTDAAAAHPVRRKDTLILLYRRGSVFAAQPRRIREQVRTGLRSAPRGTATRASRLRTVEPTPSPPMRSGRWKRGEVTSLPASCDQ